MTKYEKKICLFRVNIRKERMRRSKNKIVATGTFS